MTEPLSKEEQNHIKSVDRRFVSLDQQKEWLDRALATIDEYHQREQKLVEALKGIADDGIENSRDPRTLIAKAALREIEQESKASHGKE